jgi:hypothetical protein
MKINEHKFFTNFKMMEIKIKKTITVFVILCLSLAAQSQVTKTINVTTVGTLSNLLTAIEKTTVTNLIVTGNIDARDFKILRDSMKVLAALDLSAVNISAYTGTAGTNNTTSAAYPANEIPTEAFYNCRALTIITIPSSVISIGSSAFQNCIGLTTISIPLSVTSIGSSAFNYCIGLTTITVESGNLNYSSLDGVLFNKNQTELIQYPCNRINSSYSILSSVTSIGSSAFSDCSNLTTISIPSSVTSIGIYAFMYCSGLTSVTIPSSVTSISSYAFYRCISLTNVTIPPSVTSIGGSAFYGCSGLTNITIPSSVTSIGIYAFMYCSGLTNVTIPSSVTSIGIYAFMYCSGLTSVTIPSSVTSIGSYAFYGCSGLTSVTIPSSVTSIGSYAFYGCSGLTTISIPSLVYSIGSYAFYRCSGLNSIFSLAPYPLYLTSSSVFSGVNTTTCKLYVPIGSKSLYQAAVQWKDFTNIVEFDPTSIKNVSVQGLAFYPSAFSEGFRINGIADVAILSIYDLKGRLLLTKAITGNEYISASGLSKGTYIAKVQVGKNTTNHKIVKL